MLRNVKLHIQYNGKKVSENLAPYIQDFCYTDAMSGDLDDLSIVVSDQERKWQQSWMPMDGDHILAAIEVLDWQKEGQKKKIPCGTFHVDQLKFEGAPDKLTIQATSFPVSADVRQEKRTKVWEKVKLSVIATEIAKRAKLKLIREVPTDPTYDRLEQQQKTDFGFLREIAKQEGMACKVTAGKLVLYDEAKFEKGNVVATFVRGTDRILNYRFDWSASQCAYRGCELTYEEEETKSSKRKGKVQAIKKESKVTYTPPHAPKIGALLRIHEYTKSKADALRIAKNRLREQNKKANVVEMTVVGDIRMAAGVVIQIKGFGKFDAKYIVDKVVHQVNERGYISHMNIRKVLGW